MMLSARQGCGTAEASVGHMLMAMASDAGARPGTDAVFYDAYVEPANLTDDELTELWEAGTVFEKGSRTVTTSALAGHCCAAVQGSWPSQGYRRVRSGRAMLMGAPTSTAGS